MSRSFLNSGYFRQLFHPILTIYICILYLCSLLYVGHTYMLMSLTIVNFVQVLDMLQVILPKACVLIVQ